MRLTTAVPRGLTAGALALALGWATAPGSAAAAPPTNALGNVPAAADEGSAWSTSFEAGQPQPLESTVEVDGDSPRQQNVTGGAAADGSLLGSVSAVTASAENAPGEVAANLTDANPDTKWLAFARTGWVRYQLTQPKRALTWSLTSGNDEPGRDPKDVTLQGSADGTTWTDLDRRTGLAFATRGQKQTFDVTTPGDFTYYRLDVTANNGASIVQLADWGLFGAIEPGEPELSPIVSTVGSGPRSGYNVKAQVGWTGVKALRYGGRHTASGRGYAWNRLFDVDVPVGQRSQLTYKIIPDMITGDLSYPSTYTAVDLKFTDGTYLSGLGASDSHDTAASPNGQGVGKILYAAQWNSVVIDLGPKAAGKTIDAILVGYDNTAGATKETTFGGWIDDLKIDPSPAALDRTSPTNAVDIRRGTNSSGSFSRGNNLPISAVPNGFTFFTPVTNANSQSWQYDYQSGNNAQNRPVLQGLGISHEPSPWMGDRNQMSVMPSITSGTPTGSASGRGLAFDHATEVSRPDHYRVHLDGGIIAETAPADHGGIWRFTFPEGAPKGSLVIDTVDNNGSFTVDTATGTLTGWVDNGSGLSVGRSRMFVHGVFDRPASATGTAPNGHTGTRFASFDTTTDRDVELRIATSFISLDQAKRNHDLELSGKSFNDVQGAAKALWDKRLRVVEVEDASDSELTTLYSNLYRLNLYPNSQFENTGTASAPRYQYASPVSPKSGNATPTTTNAAIKDGKIYVNNGFWDTYRTVWPAYALLYPEVAAEIADGFVQQFRDGGWVARWSSPGYADLMTGTSSDVSFADLFVKGVDLPDKLGTYEAALRNATVLPPSSGVGRKGMDSSQFLGYTPDTAHESVSWGLEGFINDFGIGNHAAKLATDPSVPAARQAQLKEESEYFLKRATDYVNHFDPETGFLRVRQAGGEFAPNYDPDAWGNGYTETNGWNFAFHAPQDGNGLANLLGGREALADKLDEFFTRPETGTKPGSYGGIIHEIIEARDVRMGMFGMSNQVSHHIPYMYNWTGKQWRTAETVREVLRRLYVGSEIGQGYPGDEDNGEQSAWNTLSSLGIYPLQVGSAEWAVGSPKFTKATVHRAQGDLVVNAPANSAKNIYVQKLKVNGDGFKNVSIPHSMMTGPTTIDFTMGSSPSDYGSKPNAAPPSLTKGDAKPAPLRDATGPNRGTVTAPGATNAKALVDNSSTTSTTFDSATPTVTYTLSGIGQRATFYTLTNGSAAGEPKAWRVEGFKNGSWTTIDTRQDQSFTWRTQTRPFKIATPGTYTAYRLVVTASTGTPTLSEVEFLTDGSHAENTGIKVSPATDLEGLEGQAISGTIATFSGGKGTAAADYTATIAWGDGATSTGTITAGELGAFTVRASHTWEEPGVYEPVITVKDAKGQAAATAVVTVHQAVVPSYAEGFDLVCIGNPGQEIPCDGDQAAVSRPALAAAGASPGKLLTVPGTDLRFSMPAIPAGENDNATGAGQTLPITLAPGATKLSLIGTATQKDQDTTGTVTYTDGTSTAYRIQYGDWCGGVKFDNLLAVEMTSRLNGTGTDSCHLKLFATAPLTIPAGKTVQSVTLPTQTGDPHANGRIHVFSVADNGTPLEVTPAASATAKSGVATTVTLGEVAGGVLGEDGYSARVAWGDGSPTTNATVTVAADGTATLSGSHTWAKPGTYTVRILVGDSRNDTVAQVTVTVT
ncbi:GH92 family glycosyl hydrolase [Knoellia subterranea]|uniref:ATP-binding protein n=1 Tax=Knoellia subterranea KCTC 19937 TaxID=1385521 RepID=A0A0A0JJU7_9MICO|nr:GH92 family glycosyl hydrolase [Knoellia subterranea]KGN37378.1 ATP-binding protein [Knoellia subterranea KCTC 19937]